MAALWPVATRSLRASFGPSSASSRALRFSARPIYQPTPSAAVRQKSGPYGYTQAKALYFSHPAEPIDALHLHTHSISPGLPAGAVLVRTLAAPINPSDVNVIQGSYGAKPTYTTLLGTPEPAVIPGNEGCLEVVSVGPSVSGLAKGDWAIPAATGFGTFRTHALVENAAKVLFKIDRTGLSPLQAARVSVNPCSASRMLRDHVDLVALSTKRFASPGPAPKGGAWFVQNGANSGVGRAAVQLGKLWGLRSINVVRERSTPEETAALKQELADLGATVVITEKEFLDRRAGAALLGELTEGGSDPVLLGLNCVGGKSAANMVRWLGPTGTMVTYGGMSRESFPFPTGPHIFKRLKFEGFWLSEWSKEHPEEKKRTVNDILDLIRQGKFKDVPMQEVPWNWETKEKTLREAVQGTLEGFRSGKGVFLFGET